MTGVIDLEQKRIEKRIAQARERYEIAEGRYANGEITFEEFQAETQRCLRVWFGMLP
jgi:uncharacterized membrane protein